MKESIKKVAHLARLKPTPSAGEKLVQKAKSIIDFVEQLKNLDTSKIEATSHAIDITNAFREDTVQKFEGTKKILENAPNHYENLFEVPKVIDEN
ncbi:MAG: hypothetical protein A2W61_03615 [Deltaproteobacteria bacterium RIFCSPLOWO2_01_44_7]|nr:MAG: hypothetical protein A2712_08460 [Deltaproteobacteria bacterium RIFCSPHIGHO2_01_FULL_43_49]OGQ14630.1 MAG: hypothetical protein A3D22_08540 [Deltaproteobacteria bacterium RIFCSPHIGHO2_02_FULL_44_53]OGQ28016.1 MAG: hypothetical protein A3D98_07250 [Deltaproteobacteria bacterium RIFCSPHIGHO2_12_FULL_44_21]OGQ31228.1 MAG: hypothetical protein A2979_07300 [Deltaproteobacteria bacterium RIFCSPLOWO2_01_FULL_45_74]OGQ42699.1 MAG: hypothetical protein A2W61_03615 [Deltaproteobacteria bacterium 